MNIGIDIRAAKWYRGTGIGTYTYQLVNSLNNQDIKNTYNLYSDNSSIDIPFNSNFNTVLSSNEPSSNFWESVQKPMAVDPSSLNLYHVPQNGMGLPESSEVPVVITLHDTIPLHMPETVSDTYLNLFNSKMPELINRCQGIITVSEYSKRDIINDFNFPEDRVFVTHLASENIYRPIDKILCSSMVKNHYNLPDNYILYVGGFSPRKNIAGLIKAYSLIRNKLPLGMKLVIAGTKGKSFSIYSDLAYKLNIAEDVIFPGFIDMEYMPYLYGAAELLVYPSFYEGFGLPPLEAMACGVPVIASNVTSLPEVLGDSALLCNPDNIYELASFIIEVIENSRLRQILINRGFSKASSLNWNKTAANTIKIYKSLLK